MAATPSPKRIYIRMTSWRRKRFLVLLAECGNIRAAAELAGVGIGAVYRLKKKEPGFAAHMAAAKAGASARLAVEHESPEAPPPSGGRSMSRSPCPPDMAAKCGALRTRSSPANAGEDFGGLVVRRGMGGRLQLMAPGRPYWEPERHDEIFLRALRGTGNVEASARAAGFTKKVAYDQMRARPAFAAACLRARKEAEPRLNDLLALQSVRWSRAAYDEAFEGEPLDERDVDRALRTLEYWERQKKRRAGG